MTWETLPAPPEMEQKMMSWVTANPSYDFYFYDASDRANFLKANFEPAVYAAYDELIPKAFKADLWRYCVLFAEGGIYVDSKCEAFMSIDDIIRDADECVVPHDTDDLVAIAWLAFRPGHPILKRIIEYIVDFVGRRDKSPHPLGLTGPAIFSAIFNAHFGISKRLPGTVTDTYQVLLYKDDQIFSADGKLLCKTTYAGYKEKSNPIWKHYPQLWAMDIVFKSKVSPAVLTFIDRDIKDSEILGVIRDHLGSARN
jgi:mannosyltransferase OCH1-like enzyme